MRAFVQQHQDGFLHRIQVLSHQPDLARLRQEHAAHVGADVRPEASRRIRQVRLRRRDVDLDAGHVVGQEAQHVDRHAAAGAAQGTRGIRRQQRRFFTGIVSVQRLEVAFGCTSCAAHVFQEFQVLLARSGQFRLFRPGVFDLVIARIRDRALGLFLPLLEVHEVAG